MTNAYRDENHVSTLLGVSSVDGVTPVTLWADPTTHRLLTDAPGAGTGTVTDVSVTTANGVSGVVATSTTTPAITLTLGAITPTTVRGLTITTTTGTFTLTNAKTFAVTNSLTLSGTDSTVMTFPTTSATIARTDAANTFTGVQTFSTPIAAGSVATMTSTVGGGVPTPPNDASKFLNGQGAFTVPAGGGDMVLASVQTVTGAKTFGTIGGAVGKLILAGSTSGSSILNAAAVAGTTTMTLPTASTTLVGTDTTDTLTNKTLNLTSNTLTGTKAQFNTSVSDGDIVFLDSTDTITGVKTMTGLNSVLVSSSGLTVRNPANTFKYTITGAAIAADRVLTLPLTAGTLALTSDITGTNSNTNTGDQTITNTSDATSHTVTLSASGGSVQLIEGTNITLTTGGTGSAGTVTIASTAGGSGTVTNTGGNLTSNAVVLGAGTVDTKVSTGITTDGGSQVNLGVNATTIGKVKMFGNTSGDVTIQPTAAAGTATVQTLPATTGTLVNRVTTANGVSASNSDGALTVTLGAITPTSVNGALILGGSGGGGNVYLGTTSIPSPSGSENVGIGHHALASEGGGNNNTAVGHGAGIALSGTVDNVAIGSYALSTGSGDRSVAIGAYAGRYETGSNAFYVDNQNRTNTAGDQAGALLYGTFNATPSSQTLKTNSAFEATYGMNIPTGQTYKINGVAIAGGDVTKVGTPVNNQVGVWTGDGTIEGDTALTFDTATDRLSLTTSGILETGTIELGAASDTTIARASAGVASIEGNNIVVNTSSPTLATITTTGNIELGNASDTTVSRSAAGVIAVEGVVIPSISSTNTLTNKRITRRVTTTNAPGATPTTNTDNVDVMNFTGLGTAITSMSTNLSGTPVDGDLIMFRFTDDGTARAITWGASFAATTVALPTTTVISTMLRVGFQYSGSTWKCIATC